MPTRSNRIEVDLKLLQDRNIEKLLDFGKQFDSSISRLADALKSQEERMEDGGASAAVGRAGKLSPNASTGATIVHAPGPSGYRMGGSAGGGGGSMTGTGFSGGFYNGGPSVAPGGPTSGDQDSGGFETQFVRAQKRIGGVPVGLRQTLGYAAEGALKIPGLSPERAQQVNEALFAGQAISANASLAYQHMQGAFGAILGPTQLGQNLGASREGGFLGTGLFSSAFNRGVSEVWNTAKMADFGFNPNYSMAEARSARQATQDFGYSGTMANVINDQLKQLKIHQNVDPNTAMAFLDPLVRFGNAAQSSEALVNALRSLPAAANAASMNLQTFIKSITQASEQIGQTLGQQPGQVLPTLEAFSSTTGLSPEKATGLFSQQNMIIAAAMTGKSITSLMEEPKAASQMEYPLALFKNMTGGLSAEQLYNLRRTNRAQYDSIMNGVNMLYLQNPQIFGGLSPREILNMQIRNHGKTIQHTALTQDINKIDPRQASSINHIQSLLSQYGEGLGGRFQQWRNEYLHHNQIKSQADLTRYRAQARNQAMKMLGEHQQKAARRAAVTIELGPKARDWFQILTKQTGQEAQNRNQKGFFGRAANWIENNPVRVGADILSGGLNEGIEWGAHQIGLPGPSDVADSALHGIEHLF